MSAIIKAENLTYTYPGDSDTPPVSAVKNVTLEIEEGSYTAIVGHNGSGKSTLAKLLCLIIPQDSGQLYINGTLMNADSSYEDVMKARRRVGMVFQNPDNQIVATIVEEDVAFGPENLGLPSNEIRRRVDEALSIVGMSRYARHSPHRLSGGQKQRVAIAGVIAMKRKCIIFDESTAMLDPVGRKEVIETMERLNREEGITVINITHYMNEAARADRVIVMNDGEIVMDASPAAVFSKAEELWRLGLDVPQTTELLYILREAGLNVEIDRFDTEKCAEAIAAAIQGRQV